MNPPVASYGADRVGFIAASCLRGNPLNQDERGFWTIVGIVAAFTVPALWIVLRRRRD